MYRGKQLEDFFRRYESYNRFDIHDYIGKYKELGLPKNVCAAQLNKSFKQTIKISAINVWKLSIVLSALYKLKYIYNIDFQNNNSKMFGRLET